MEQSAELEFLGLTIVIEGSRGKFSGIIHAN
jgi:hypothetical protein